MFILSSDKFYRNMNIGKDFWSSFTTSSASFRQFAAGNTILFQIKVCGRKIKETTLARYFIKLTVCLSFK